MDSKIKNSPDYNLDSLIIRSLLFFLIWFVLSFFSQYLQNIIAGTISLAPFLIFGSMWIIKTCKKVLTIKKENPEAKISLLEFMAGLFLILFGMIPSILIIFSIGALREYVNHDGSGLFILIAIPGLVFFQTMSTIGFCTVNIITKTGPDIQKF